MMENPRPRTRREVWPLLVLTIAVIAITACTPAGVQQGVYSIRIEDGELGLIGAQAGIPVWSPSAETVAWGNEDGLFLRTLDDPESSRLSASPVVGAPAWSPDGLSLAYIDRDRAALVVVIVDSGLEQFTQPLDARGVPADRFPLPTFGGPAWAPDGSRLAFVCWDGAGDEICLTRSNGTGRRQITRLERLRLVGQNAQPQSAQAASNTGPPAWSPDGRLLAVAVYPERSGAPTGVFLVDPEVGVGRRVSSLQPNSALSWSPDGGSLLFSAFRRGRSDAFRVVLAENIQQRITELLPEGSRNPALSPDGSRIAVESGGGIVVLGTQGTVQAFAVPALRSAYPAWNAGGSVIAVTAAGDPIGSYN